MERADVRGGEFARGRTRRLAAFAAAMTATPIVSEKSIDYLRFMWGHRPTVWVEGTIVVAAAAFEITDFALVYLRTRTL